jgi:hypothetical protein
VGQDCILLAGFQPAFSGLSSAPQRAPMKSALQLAKLPHKLTQQERASTNRHEGYAEHGRRV